MTTTSARYPADATAVAVVVLAVVLTIGAGVAVSYGFARDDNGWILAGAGVFAPVLVAATHGAAGLVSENRRTAGGAAFAGLVCLFIVTIVVSQPWWGTDATAQGQLLFLASSDASAHVYLHRTPGGAELSHRRDPAPLVGGQGYHFVCQVELTDSSRWLRFADRSYWVPATALRTVKGRSVQSLAAC